MKRFLWMVILILLLGAALRIIGMAWGLPYQLEPDEPVLFINAWERATTGIASFMREYPPLYPMILSSERKLITYAFGEDTPQVIYFFFARCTSMFLSLIMLASAYRLGKAINGNYTGLAFMTFLAVESKVALELNWIIKPDTLAWLFTIWTLWAAIIAMKQHSWAWLGASIILGGLATIAKFNLALVFIAVIYAACHLLVGKRQWLLWLLPLTVVVGIVGIRLALRTYWVSDIAPYFADCRTQVDLSAANVDEPPFCNLFLTLQKHARPFYERDTFLNQNTQITFEHLINQLGDVFSWWRLGIGAIVAGSWLLLARREDKSAIAMLSMLVGCALLLFTLFEVQHPIRQYYILILALGLMLAIFLGRIEQKPIYAGLMLLLFIPPLFPAIERRIDLRKTDTREATATYLLENAPLGAAILVEYDRVEFMSQYGGFPEYDNYFHSIALQSIYEKEVESLAEQGIAYVVVDERSGNRGGYYAHPQDFPEEKYQVVLNLESDEYIGPKRKIYRTFRPQQNTDFHFGEVARLMGYDQVIDKQTLRLKLYWQSLGENLPDYSVFVHIINTETGEAVIRQDAAPNPATIWWSKQEWIFETRVISLAELASGTYFIRMGMYDPISGQRRLLENGADFIELVPFEY